MFKTLAFFLFERISQKLSIMVSYYACCSFLFCFTLKVQSQLIQDLEIQNNILQEMVNIRNAVLS